jgi:hypothetical protein
MNNNPRNTPATENEMNWNNAWMSYTGPVTVVLETGLVREGEATGYLQRRTEGAVWPCA